MQNSKCLATNSSTSQIILCGSESILILLKKMILLLKKMNGILAFGTRVWFNI